MTKNRKEYDRGQILRNAISVLQNELGYKSVEEERIGDEVCAVARKEGHPAVIVFVPDVDGPIRPEDQELAQELGASIEGVANYVWATSSGKRDDGYIFSWLPDQECQVSAVPENETSSYVAEPKAVYRPKADPLGFKKLQREFDELHELIYAAREPVDGANDLTAQLCKCIFLKMHIERDPDFRTQAGGPYLVEVFQEAYIRQHGANAVAEIKRAFEVARSLPEYNVKDDKGRSFEIFDEDDFIKFRKPETYAEIARILNAHHLTSPEETGIEDDILGRAFDVMLRAKFESKGGMGIYLTPQQVRDAMVQIVLHDILKEDPGLITRQETRTGSVQFRVCDPCCGSGGFLVTGMREVRKQVNKLLGLSELQRATLLGRIFSEGFEGADSSPNMILLARINMALHGDAKPRVFRVSNSLTTDTFLPESFDLILTNPPFKKGGIKASEQPELMKAFQSDVVDGRPKMAGDGLALGAKPDAKGNWKPVGSIDPAVLFIDRCLQLLKPGGRLLIVLPDGILCNSGDRYVREYLMGRKDEATGRFIGGKAIVKAVVSLPPVTFQLSGAGAKTSFVYLQKKRPGDEQGPVFMAVAESVGFDVKQNKEVLTGENHLVRILEAYKAGPPTDHEDEP
ncbi:MAG: N-6 DNA methylase [Candidatus Thiodiazotropha sp.]